MNVFIQGMRRSGTTIFFDIFWKDNRFDCYYEPFAAEKIGVWGGGSGVRSSVDYFKKIRECRSEFIHHYKEPVSVDMLNYGAPGQPELEFKKNLPVFCRNYIKFIISRSHSTVVKFTRMYCKINELKKIDHKAKLIHIVRNPCSVATSYLFGKDKIYKSKFLKKDYFFKARTNNSRWSSYPFSQHILGLNEYRHLASIEDFLRILLIWKYTFQETYETGKKVFGKNYLLLRHEDLCTDPANTVKVLYTFLNRTWSQKVANWATTHVKKNSLPFDPHNDKWIDGLNRLDMKEDLKLAGYIS